MKVKSNRSNKDSNRSRRKFGLVRWQTLTVLAVVVLLVGAVGYKSLGQSQANGTWYFWATRQGNVWSNPWLYYNYGTNSYLPYGYDYDFDLPIGWWDVSCQYQTNWTKSYGGYSNNWWVRLSDNQGKYSARWVNEVFLSANTSGWHGSAPGLRICTDSSHP